MTERDDCTLLDVGRAPAPFELRGVDCRLYHDHGKATLDSISFVGNRRRMCLMAAVGTSACALTACLILLYQVAFRSASVASIHYECLYAVGGGEMLATGGFPQARVRTPDCVKAFEVYFAEGGQYFKDLEEAGVAALGYYQTHHFVNATPSQMLVFDIDETTLSNLDYNLATKFGTVQVSKTLDEWQLSRPSPAIEPMLEVYQTAYASGLSVAFVTGRTEGGRPGTVDNLKRAGYGVQCTTAVNGTVVRSSDPCYVRLDMRGEDDKHKPASVYKPERRKRLMDDGYVLVGSFGDQFSDLEGAFPAEASWKLPNPMYFIL